MIDDIFLKNLPCIDLHGYDRDMARVATLDFINENLLLGNKKFIIIHGIGSGIVKKSVYEVLKQNKHVSNYHIDIYNSGVTIVYLK